VDVRPAYEHVFVPRYTETEAREAVAAASSYTEVLRRLGMRPAGGNHRTLRRYVDEVWRIPTDHFDPHAARGARGRRRAAPLETVLVEGSTYSRGTLKKRLYESGLKDRCCELCGQGESWRGRPMSLILDHINGVATDNRIENLRIVCPNCAATLDTHCGKNVNRIRVCSRCGESFVPKGREQRHCSQSCGGRSEASVRAQVAARTVERPPYEQLVREIAESSYVAVGRKYGVSDNAIRKWLRAYERELGVMPLPRAA
jgi:hypothetical protein